MPQSLLILDSAWSKYWKCLASMNVREKLYHLLLILGVAGFLVLATPVDAFASLACQKSYSEKETVSLAYIEKRAEEWVEKKRCTCCHTTLGFALVVPSPETNSGALKLRSYIQGRMETWGQYRPWPGPYPAEKLRPTEAVLNAASLVAMDLKNDGKTLTPLTYQALQLMLDEVGVRRFSDGRTEIMNKSFDWLDHLRLGPLEGTNADYWGAALALNTLAQTPKSFQKQAQVQVKIKTIKEDLAVRFESQDIHNQLMAIQASSKLGKFLPSQAVKKVMDKLKSLQKADGGWSLPDLAVAYRDIPAERFQVSDAYATSVAVLALMQTNHTGPMVQKAIQWLLNNKKSDGYWEGHSLNYGRVTEFMSDLASAYAQMAIQKAQERNIL